MRHCEGRQDVNERVKKKSKGKERKEEILLYSILRSASPITRCLSPLLKDLCPALGSIAASRCSFLYDSLALYTTHTLLNDLSRAVEKSLGSSGIVSSSAHVSHPPQSSRERERETKQQASHRLLKRERQKKKNKTCRQSASVWTVAVRPDAPLASWN